MANPVVQKLAELTVEVINDSENVVGSGNLLQNFTGSAKYLPQFFSILTEVKDIRQELSSIDVDEVVDLVKTIGKIDLPGELADRIKDSIVAAAISGLQAFEHWNNGTKLIAEAPKAA